jgi:hypothetical protein
MASTRLDTIAAREVRIPDANLPVRLVPVFGGAHGAVQHLVRFPPGWARPRPGAYDRAEEALWLTGSFGMGSCSYRAGTYAWWPAGHARGPSAAPGGAEALAWFDGPPRWTPGAATTADAAARGVVSVEWSAPPLSDGPVEGLPGRLLNDCGHHSAWMLERTADVVTPRHLHLYSVPAHEWSTVAPGTRLPDLPGPVFCRALRVDDGRVGP